MPQAGARLVGRPPGPLQLPDSLPQREEIELVGIDLGEGQPIGFDALKRHHPGLRTIRFMVVS